MAMDTVMDMAMVDMVIMDTMARGMLMPSQGMVMVMDMVMDMDMVDMVIMDTMARGLLMPDMDMVATDMVMATAMDMDMVMGMDTMVKHQLFHCSKSSVKEVDSSESSQKRHTNKI